MGVKAFFLLSLLVAFAAAAPQSTPTATSDKDVQTVLKVVLGVLRGFGETDIPDLSGCISDTESFVTNVEAAVQDFTTKTAAGVAKGLQELSEAVKVVPAALATCKQAAAEAQKLEQILAMLKNPKTLVYNVGKNLVVNGKDIFGEINGAVGAWKSQNWDLFGYDVGQALAKLLGVGAETTLTVTAKDVEYIVIGVLKGVASESIPDLETCIGDVSSVAKDVETAIKDFESKSLSGIKNGLQEISAAMKIVPQAVAACKQSVEEAQKLEQFLKTLASPKTLVYNVGHNLIVNGHDIFNEINAAISAWKSQQYLQFGVSIGEALAKLVLGTETAIVSEDKAAAINQIKGLGWVAGVPSRFKFTNAQQARRLLGTVIQPSHAKKVSYQHLSKFFDVPTEFDAREQKDWKAWNCIHPIRDQQQCGSCWAFGATEALSDRFCIASQGKVNVVLSPEDLVSCDSADMGCSGGWLDKAWNYIENTGVVADSCFSYSAGSGVAPQCVSSCQDGSPFTKYKANNIAQYTDVASIQMAIMTHGPVEAAFTVYEDFFSYTSGVYTHTSQQIAGGHAIKIIGWGEDNGTPYWLVANSWGTGWGLQGYFKIARGTNECGIESGVIAGLPVV